MDVSQSGQPTPESRRPFFRSPLAAALLVISGAVAGLLIAGRSPSSLSSGTEPPAADPAPALASSTVAASPADRSLEGRPIASDDALRSRLSRLKPGDHASMGVLRRGRRLEADVVLAVPPVDRRRG